MLSGVRFASSYVYSPRGHSRLAARSRQLCGAIKGADSRLMARYGARVRQLLDDDPSVKALFGTHAVLVPVPGRMPRPCSSTVAASLTQALLEAGVGSCMCPILHRIECVARSATSPAQRRPSVDAHYRSFRVDASGWAEGHLDTPLRMVLVDDVVTKGRTLLAAAWRLQEAFPRAQIRAFAMLRTLGFVEDIESLIAPCCGEIRWRRGDARRMP